MESNLKNILLSMKGFFMDLDKITDIEVLRNMLKSVMVQMKKTLETPTHAYKKDEWYFFIQDDEYIFLYCEDPSTGLTLTYDEAEEYLIDF